MMKKLLILLTYCVLATILVVAATTFRTRVLSMDNILPTNYVRSILQDSKGNIWMGTVDGLYRYDAISLNVIKPTAKGNRSLMADYRIQNIRLWQDRFIWMRVRGQRFSMYDTHKDQFVDYTGNGTSMDSYRTYTMLDNGELWLYDDQKGCKRITFDGKQFCSKIYNTEQKDIPDNHIRFVKEGIDDRVWIGTAHGLSLVGKDGKATIIDRNKQFAAFALVDGVEYLFTSNREVLKADKQGKLKLITTYEGDAVPKAMATAVVGQRVFVATDKELLEFDTKSKQIGKSNTILANNVTIENDNIYNKVITQEDGQLWYLDQKTQDIIHLNLFEDAQKSKGIFRVYVIAGKDDMIWISTYGNGLFAYNKKTKQNFHYTAQQEESPIQSNYLQNIFEDKSGNIWVCQENLGVTCFTPQKDAAKYVYFTNPHDMGHANCIRLMDRLTDGRIVVTNQLNGVKLADGNLQILQTADRRFDDDVVALAYDKKGEPWVGTRSTGIYAGYKNYQHNKKDDASLSEGKISGIVCDLQGRMWICMFESGLNLAVPQGDGYIFKHFLQDVYEPRALFIDHAGWIWMCSNDGIFYFHPDQLIKDPKNYQHFDISEGKVNEVLCLFEDSKQQVWAGSLGEGVTVFDNQKAGKPKKVAQYTEKDGLVNDDVQSVIEDRQHNIWLATDYGISLFETANKSFHNYFPSSNNLGNITNVNSAIMLDNGNLAFGTLHGIMIIDPQHISQEQPIFQLAITDLEINGISIREMDDDSPLEEAIEYVQEITLNHAQNSLTFKFSDFEFTNSRSSRFSYKLEHIDQDWSPLSTINFATYKNLKPGTYILHVRSCNSRGEWNPQEAKLKITIRPPFWATWWAYLIYMLLVAGILTTIIRQLKHTQELRNKIKMEEQLTEFKLKFFTNISHEFRTPLTIIKGAMERINAVGNIPGDMKQPVSAMQKSTDRMLRLVNQLLEFRKMQNNKLQLALEEADIITYIKDIFLTFQQTAENKQISYTFQPFAHHYTMFFTKSYLDKIMYNLLSNAFKYTMSRHSVMVKVTQDESLHQINISVIDTGIGIPEENRKSLFDRFNQSVYQSDSIGIGLHMTYELAKTHHGDITYLPNPDGGSIFTLTLPTDKSVYQERDFLVAGNELLTEQNMQEKAVISEYREMAPRPMNSQLVMIVEDDNDVRDFLQQELGKYFETAVVNNGQEALEHIQEEKPSLIVSDVKMPIMDGFELTRKIRADKELADIPIILLTAMTSEEKQVKGLESGADDYLAKPFSAKILIAKCNQLIMQRNTLKGQYAKEVISSPTIPEIITDEQDKRFQELLDIWLSSHYSDSNIDINLFADSMKYGRTNFFKKVKKVTGKTPNEYIRTFRMTKAAELMKDDTLTIAEIAYKVGIDDPYYFSKTFKSYFGISPSQYRKGEKPKA